MFIIFKDVRIGPAERSLGQPRWSEKCGITSPPGISQDQRCRFGTAIDLGPHRCGAIGAEVFILVTVGQHQQQPFANRNGLPAFRTVKLGSFELLIHGRLIVSGRLTLRPAAVGIGFHDTIQVLEVRFDFDNRLNSLIY